MGRTLFIDRLSVQYSLANAAAIDRITLELNAARSLAILGPSGSGKSTFLNAIAGLLEGQHHVRLGGTVQLAATGAGDGPTQPRFPYVSLLPQDPRHVLSGFVSSVREEFQLTLRQAGIPEREWTASIQQVVHSLDIGHLLDRDPGTLSGGEIQSVALATMAVAQPKLLLLDEPASALDQDRVGRLTRYLLNRPPHLSVILADTTLHSAVLACDDVAMLEHGRLVFRGTREEFWRRLPEFQDIVSIGDWLEVRRRYREPDPRSFRAALESIC